jgi:hypothetical protein
MSTCKFNVMIAFRDVKAMKMHLNSEQYHITVELCRRVSEIFDMVGDVGDLVPGI